MRSIRQLSRGLFLAVAAAAVIAGCASLGVPTPQTFNEKEAAAIVSVTSIRDTATALLRTDRISVADAKNVQEQADNARAAIVVAEQIHATDPGAAENRLSAIIVGLNAISTYLAGRK